MEVDNIAKINQKVYSLKKKLVKGFNFMQITKQCQNKFHSIACDVVFTTTLYCAHSFTKCQPRVHKITSKLQTHMKKLLYRVLETTSKHMAQWLFDWGLCQYCKMEKKVIFFSRNNNWSKIFQRAAINILKTLCTFIFLCIDSLHILQVCCTPFIPFFGQTTAAGKKENVVYFFSRLNESSSF